MARYPHQMQESHKIALSQSKPYLKILMAER